MRLPLRPRHARITLQQRQYLCSRASYPVQSRVRDSAEPWHRRRTPARRPSPPDSLCVAVVALHRIRLRRRREGGGLPRRGPGVPDGAIFLPPLTSDARVSRAGVSVDRARGLFFSFCIPTRRILDSWRANRPPSPGSVRCRLLLALRPLTLFVPPEWPCTGTWLPHEPTGTWQGGRVHSSLRFLH